MWNSKWNEIHHSFLPPWVTNRRIGIYIDIYIYLYMYLCACVYIDVFERGILFRPVGSALLFWSTMTMYILWGGVMAALSVRVFEPADLGVRARFRLAGHTSDCWSSCPLAGGGRPVGGVSPTIKHPGRCDACASLKPRGGRGGDGSYICFSFFRSPSAPLIYLITLGLQTHTHTHTHTHRQTNKHMHTLTHSTTHTLSLTHSHTLTLTPSLPHCLTQPLMCVCQGTGDSLWGSVITLSHSDAPQWAHVSTGVTGVTGVL